MKRTVVALALLALATAPAAAADVPAGFISHPELASRVQFLVPHPISVYCATSDQAWEDAVAAFHTRDGTGFASAVGGDSMYLIQSVCRPLLAKLARQSWGWLAFSRGLLTIGHEAAHLAGHINEHETDCAALAAVRQIAMNFGIHKAANLRRVVGYATSLHAAAPPEYSAPCG